MSLCLLVWRCSFIDKILSSWKQRAGLWYKTTANYNNIYYYRIIDQVNAPRGNPCQISDALVRLGSSCGTTWPTARWMARGGSSRRCSPPAPLAVRAAGGPGGLSRGCARRRWWPSLLAARCGCPPQHRCALRPHGSAPHCQALPGFVLGRAFKCRRWKWSVSPHLALHLKSKTSQDTCEFIIQH